MLVPNKVRKNVIFIGIKEHDRFVPKATGFIVSKITEQHRFLHMVTAEHVISGLKARNYERPYVRLNMESGEGRMFPTEYHDWEFHPDPNVQTDVAVARCAIDRMAVIYSHTPVESFATDNVIADEKIGAGEEVFVVGLFKSHYGLEKNVPIVRTGNIALMPEEPIKTRYAGYIDAYLIEARSIGGLSGSPVWVHLAPLRVVDGKVMRSRKGQYYLLGLMHGHFDVENLNEDVVVDDSTGSSINTGIGVVVPASKILDIIDQPAWEEVRREIVQRIRSQGGATVNLRAVPEIDAKESKSPTKVDNS